MTISFDASLNYLHRKCMSTYELGQVKIYEIAETEFLNHCEYFRLLVTVYISMLYLL